MCVKCPMTTKSYGLRRKSRSKTIVFLQALHVYEHPPFTNFTGRKKLFRNSFRGITRTGGDIITRKILENSFPWKYQSKHGNLGVALCNAGIAMKFLENLIINYWKTFGWVKIWWVSLSYKKDLKLTFSMWRWIWKKHFPQTLLVQGSLLCLFAGSCEEQLCNNNPH